MGEFREIRTGVYFLCKAQEVVYVGQSYDVLSRLKQHEWDQKSFDSVLMISVPEHLLNEAEQYWLERIKPRLNAKYRIDPVEDGDPDLSKWAAAEQVEAKFGIRKGTLNKLANAKQIQSRFIKARGPLCKPVRFFSIQSIRELLEANVI